ncbi:hypothetical protein GCM10011514_39350 [Emticicia aquatilis]|uniref:YbbR-like domain-containing protein n=1 Tax=Emticicia aquatilis TaxID=1537369 RepID=A0A917DU71_9BACT|nr:hypothetical protein [Emticicia aquatilis]GGD71396.1 hypothetical protein GCM10011514_39350 [Emticicia aquatilis]
MNIKTLLLCFLAAFVIWLLNSLNKSGYSAKISYPLTIKYNDSLYISTKPLPQKLNVSLSSTGWDLLKYNLFSNATPLVYEINNPLSVSSLDNTSLLESLTVLLKRPKLNYILADTTTLHFERKKRKTIKLKVDSLGIDLQKNFVVSSLINISPSEITLEGPESVLKEYNDTIFLTIPTKRLATNFDDKVKITLPPNNLVKSNAEKALISFEVAELLK